MIGGGFTGRIIFVTAEKRKKPVAWPILTLAEKKLEEDLMADLRDIAETQGEMKLTKHAHDRFTLWYEMEIPNIKLPMDDIRSKPFLERMHDHALKVAMIFSLAESGAKIVTEKHLNMAINRCYEVLTSVPRAIKQLGSTPMAKITDKIYEKILATGPGGAKHSDTLRQVAYMVDGASFKIAIQTLIDEDQIIIKPGSGTARINPTKYVATEYTKGAKP
jgi:hypothetical protein